MGCVTRNPKLRNPFRSRKTWSTSAQQRACSVCPSQEHPLTDRRRQRSSSLLLALVIVVALALPPLPALSRPETAASRRQSLNFPAPASGRCKARKPAFFSPALAPHLEALGDGGGVRQRRGGGGVGEADEDLVGRAVQDVLPLQTRMAGPGRGQGRVRDGTGSTGSTARGLTICSGGGLSPRLMALSESDAYPSLMPIRV